MAQHHLTTHLVDLETGQVQEINGRRQALEIIEFWSLLLGKDLETSIAVYSDYKYVTEYFYQLINQKGEI
jgi:hypothetical protein